MAAKHKELSGLFSHSLQYILYYSMWRTKMGMWVWNVSGNKVI